MAAIQTGNKQAPSLAQVVAMIDTWRKLMVVWGLLPALMVLAPLLVWSSITAMNLISCGHGLLTSLGTFALTALSRSTITAYAPSIQERDLALYQSRWIVPVFSFAISRQVCIKMLDPIFSRVGLTYMLHYTPKLPYMIAVRIGAAMLLLGLAIIIRFIGPFSVVRCSPFPLVSHPISTKLRALIAKCYSIEAFLDLIAQPSDTPEVLFKSPFSIPTRQVGRRYQVPINVECLGLMILSTLIGLALSCVLQPALPDGTNPIMLFVTCASSILANLLLCCLDGISHEIDPLRYQNIDQITTITFRRLVPQMPVIFISVVIVPVGSMWVALYTTNGSFSPNLISCVMVAALSSVYLISVDTFARFCLCLPTLQISRLVEEISCDFTQESTLDVVLCSILQGDTGLIKSIWDPTQNPGTLLIEQEEVERNVRSVEIMSKILLQKEPLPSESELEQDILRISIMESFGGGTNTSSERQQAIIKNLVHPKNAPLSTSISGRGEPLAIPLVRALCAYAGGLGLALVSISEPDSKTHLSYFPAGCVTWELPPGAIVCAQWAITAASRFIVESIAHAGKTLANWRSSHLSMLVPVAFHAAFSLRRGIQKYDESASRGSSGNVIIVIAACDNAALSILEKLRAMEGTRSIDVQVHSDCRLWLDSLLTLDSSVSAVVIPQLAQEHSNLTFKPQRMFARQ